VISVPGARTAELVSPTTVAKLGVEPPGLLVSIRMTAFTG
jgi:hypothetical protein